MEKEGKGTCPKCGPERFAIILAEQYEAIKDEHVSGGTDYRILQCGGCRSLYFQTEFWFSEADEIVVEHWPQHPLRPIPAWVEDVWYIDPALHSLVDEVYKAAQHGLGVCAATAIRTAFDRAAFKLGIDPGYGFEEKVKELEKQGFLGTIDRAVFDSMVEAGSAAAHRGWKPTEDELQMLISALESFIHRSFILPVAVQKIGSNVPTRPPRPKKKSKIVNSIDPQNAPLQKVPSIP
jgi:hypothetical protein